jgi:outer membrane biosynthesis protein TonB
VLGGVAAVFFAMVVMPLTVWATSAAVDAVRDAVGADSVVLVDPEPEELPPIEIIEARFVRLGSEADPRRLPSRYIPSAATAPQPVVSPLPGEGAAPVDATATPENPLPPSPTGTRAPNQANTSTAQAQAVDARQDLLTRLGDSAEATAELAAPRFREGHADGIVDGTETVDNGNLYRGRLYSFFRRGWQVPTSIPAGELRGLACSVSIDLTADGRVGAFRITSGSGNEAFDGSVRQRLNQAVGASLPPPPADVADEYLGHSIPFRFVPPR